MNPVHTQQNSRIILFDGHCNLCTGEVQFVLKRDKKKKFRFASLQGDFGQRLLKEQQLSTTHFDTFILLENGRLFTQSTGVLRMCKALPGIWSLLYVFIIIPRFIRDGIYSWIARNRYAWFGQRAICWMPKPEWKERFID